MSLAFSSSVTSGDVVVVALNFYANVNSQTVSSMADSLSISYTKQVAPANHYNNNCGANPTYLYTQIWTGLLSSSGSDTVTATFGTSGVNTNAFLEIFEISGVGAVPTSSASQSTQVSNPSSLTTSSSVSYSATDVLIASALNSGDNYPCTNTSLGAGSGFTYISSGYSHNGFETEAVSSSSTTNFPFSASGGVSTIDYVEAGIVLSTVSIVQERGTNNTPVSGTTMSLAFSSSVNSQDIVVIAMNFYSSVSTQTLSITDSLSTSYTKQVAPANHYNNNCGANPTYLYTQIWTGLLSSSGSDTVTGTFGTSGVNTNAFIEIFELAGVSSVYSSASQSTQVSNPSSLTTSSSASYTGTSMLIASALNSGDNYPCTNTSLGAGSGFTYISSTYSHNGFETKVTSSIGTTNFPFSASGGVSTIDYVEAGIVLSGGSWQLGWKQTQSYQNYGIESNQNITGSISSSLPSGTGFGDVSAFTDSAGVWHSFGFIKNAGGQVFLQAEWLDGGGYHQKVLTCTVSTGTSYTDRIWWNSTAGAYQYDSPYASCSGSTPIWKVGESGSPYIDSNGQVDMFESGDFLASDFNNLGAWGTFDHSLRYMDQYGSWYYPTVTYDYQNGRALQAVGTHYTCTSPIKIWISSTYAPPQSPSGGRDC